MNSSVNISGSIVISNPVFIGRLFEAIRSNDFDRIQTVVDELVPPPESSGSGKNRQQTPDSRKSGGHSSSVSSVLNSGKNKDGVPLFLIACEYIQVAECNKGIEKTSSINIVRYFVEYVGQHVVSFTDKSRDNALMYAARGGDLEVVKFLLLLSRDRGTVDEPNKYGENALMYAAKAGYLEIVKLLLDHGAFVNARNAYGSTALMYAAGDGHLETVVELLAQEADIHAVADFGETPLLLAIAGGRIDTVDYLVDILLLSAEDPKSVISDDLLSKAAGKQAIHSLLVNKLSLYLNPPPTTYSGVEQPEFGYEGEDVDSLAASSPIASPVKPVDPAPSQVNPSPRVAHLTSGSAATSTAQGTSNSNNESELLTLVQQMHGMIKHQQTMMEVMMKKIEILEAKVDKKL